LGKRAREAFENTKRKKEKKQKTQKKKKNTHPTIKNKKKEKKNKTQRLVFPPLLHRKVLFALVLPSPWREAQQRFLAIG